MAPKGKSSRGRGGGQNTRATAAGGGQNSRAAAADPVENTRPAAAGGGETSRHGGGETSSRGGHQTSSRGGGQTSSHGGHQTSSRGGGQTSSRGGVNRPVASRPRTYVGQRPPLTTSGVGTSSHSSNPSAIQSATQSHATHPLDDANLHGLPKQQNQLHGEEEDDEENADPAGDYEDMLDRLLALPGRENLPLLSRHPISGVKTLWFNRHKGVLSRAISTIFRRKFDGPYYSWKVTPINIQERYFRTFARQFNWDSGITGLVKAGFPVIAKKRMKGIVSQRSENASQCRNSDRGGLGVHKHLAGQKSFIQVHQEMEEELGRPVSLGEVFMRTHTRADRSFVDQKSEQVAEAYRKTLVERLAELEEEDQDTTEISSEHSQHPRELSIDEMNDIFLKCTHTDDQGNPYGLGSLVETLHKGKRKESYASSSSTVTVVELQEQLRRKISDQDAENARRDAEHRTSQARIASLEKLILFMKDKDPDLAAFIDGNQKLLISFTIGHHNRRFLVSHRRKPQVGEEEERKREKRGRRDSQMDHDTTEISSEHSQQPRELSIDEMNDIFLKCTHTDDQGNPYGLGSLVETLHKGKRKESYASSSSTVTVVELQEQLRRKISDQDAENARRDAEHRTSQARIASLEKLILFMKDKDPDLAAFMSSSPLQQPPVIIPPSTETGTLPTTLPDTTAAALKDLAMVFVEKFRCRTRRSTKNSAEKTPDRVHSPPISPPNQSNITSRPLIHPLPQFDYTDAHYSPFALSNGDSLGNTLVSEVLDGSNFSSWKIAMFVALDAKNKIVFVDGTLPRPHEFDPSFRVWSRCNSMVKSWILNSVTKQIYKSILRFNDAVEIWKDLITRFNITNLPRSYHLTQQIWGLQQGSMSLSEYYTSLKTLWDDLDGANCADTCQNCKCCVATASKADHAKIVKFLAGLNESYTTIRSQIIMKKTIPELAQIYNLLDQDHSQRRHTTDTCYKIHGYPVGFKHKQKTAIPPEKVKPVVANLALTDGKTNVTKGIGPDGISELVGNMSKTQIQDVIAYFSTQLHNPAQPITIASVASTNDTNGSAFNDSGAIHHVSFYRNLFENLSDDLSSEVNYLLVVKIAGVGIIKLNEYITLYNVLYIPQFRLNLSDPIKEQKIGEGKQIGGLYVLNTSPDECSSLDSNTSVSLNAHCNAIVDNALWHSRLGHPLFEKIDVLRNTLEDRLQHQLLKVLGFLAMVETQYQTRVKVVRKSRPPSHLQDYYCNVVPDVQKDVRYPISAYINYAQLSEGFTAYICAVNKYPEPCTYAQAKKIKEWLDAIEIEIDALESTNTWSVCSLPDGKKPIGCKWVFKVKLNADGCLERFKARLVAKGCTQKEGLDYGDTFSPVAKMTTVKTLLSVAAAKEWSLHQLDISNAFLNDHALFTRITGNIYIALLIYVDGIVIAGNNDVAIEELKNDLAKAFKLRDLGPLKYFLGLEIARSRKGISVCQEKYTLELLEETGLLGCKPSTIPMEPSLKLALHSDEPELDNPEVYRRLIGKLMYLTITRPDITYAVYILCQFSSAPKASHLKAAYKVIHYLKGTIGLGLFYSATSDLCLKAYIDAYWNSCQDSRRSTSGYCMFLGDSLISWKSRKQDVCSASSTESEYRVMAMGSKEIAWLVKLLNEFQVPQSKHVPLFCDSTAAIHIANNSVFHERTKHVKNDCHITRDRIDQGLLKTLHVQTTNQLADVLTKPLYSALFKSHIGKMSLLSIYGSS
ncbi:Reverse transcriptase RNA-dependent DNA polymerase [Arabidopsis thaliana x Arabidopsis arenosa]|uniref:Reverse transcriptase RNA-dependent DNA polymerase n=1 Tax=Arabidopsis thaliana x Arabidopsis arenosa TaxID=1240361 RepID=A0A8T1Y7W1_9BRAS|nr:Reverse transcriptase RNA-dependent DNA polymerase [Arabidopsis thaliana x Arabidopsis arenosa]